MTNSNDSPNVSSLIGELVLDLRDHIHAARMTDDPNTRTRHFDRAMRVLDEIGEQAISVDAVVRLAKKLEAKRPRGEEE